MNVRSKAYCLLMLCIVLLLAVGCDITDNVEVFEITSRSMEPTYTRGDRVKVEMIPATSMQRGDIVVYGNPNDRQWLHRLIGLPGETIEVRDGQVFIDGELFPEPEGVTPPRYTVQPVTLGDDDYYILADNRNEASDSHNRGPIAGEQIKGRVVP